MSVLPGARRMCAVMAVGAAAVSAAGCGSAAPPVHPNVTAARTSSPPASAGSAHRSGPPPPSAAQRRRVRRWEAGPAGVRSAAIAASQRAALTALAHHDLDGAFGPCQTEQVDIERAQEGRPVPWPRLNGPYQAALARLAAATTRCLDAVGGGGHRDVVLARRGGVAALARYDAVLRALREI